MNDFTITFAPPLPRAAIVNPPPSLENLDVATVMAAYNTEHGVLYTINGKVFSYYPADLIGVLNDVHSEWGCIRERKAHDVTLCGYTVLEASFGQEGFQFRDPAWPPTPVGHPFDAAYLEGKFRLATATLWGLVQSIQNSA